jgi:hypothetical protein
LGYRTIGDSVYNNNYLADEAGDVWQPPIRVAAGLDFKLPYLGLGFRFRAKMEFGEQIAFADGSETFKGGFDMEFGLEPSYVIGKAGVLLLDVAFRANQNDSFKGKKNLTTSEQIAKDSLSHNGIMDLGLGAFFRRDFNRSCYIKAGVSATVPLGGDRYDWSPGGATDADIEAREAFKKGQIIIAVPIIIEMNLF